MENNEEAKKHAQQLVENLKGLTGPLKGLMDGLMAKLPEKDKIEVAKILKSKDVEKHVKKATEGIKDIQKLFDIK